MIELFILISLILRKHNSLQRWLIIQKKILVIFSVSVYVFQCWVEEHRKYPGPQMASRCY